MQAIQLVHPFTLDAIKGLKVGQIVELSGQIVTGRDRVHHHLFHGGACPVDLADGALYHCGPVVRGRSGEWVVRAAGPTTSARLESYMDSIVEQHQVRIIIGKGGVGERTRQACKAFGCVYLHAVGGAGNVLASRIRKVEAVHWLDRFGATEAMWVFDVEKFEAVVTIDARGWSLHDRVRRASRKKLAAILARPEPASGETALPRGD